MNREGTQFAIARAGQIDLYFQSAPGTWALFGVAVVPSGFAVTKLAMDGERVVALVDTQGSVVPGGNLVRIYEYNAADWELTDQITINDTGEFIELGRESVVSDFCLNATRVAVSSDREDCIRIHERDLGGPGNWGILKEITAEAAGVESIGESVALSGTRLATMTEEGSEIRMDVFSQNAGGANQWGFAGSLITVPDLQATRLIAHVDALSGTLGVFATPPLDSLTESSPPQSRAWVFRGVIGGGPGNWMNVADFPVRRPGVFSAPIGMGFAGEDFLYGYGPPETSTLSPAWLASVHRRSTGGTDGWQLQQILAGPGSAARMGRSISASGRFVAVGMPDDASAGIGTGSVLLWYQVPLPGNSVWVPVGRFQATTPVAGANFGASVSVIDGGGSSDWMAVGAPGENSGRGAVYLFALNNIAPTTATKRVTPSSALDPADGFGSSVSLWPDNRLAVGSPGDEDAGTNAGAAFIFSQNLGGTNNWGQQKKIPRPLGETHPGFASTLVFTSDLLCVALPSMGTTSGKIFAYAVDQGGTNNWGQLSFKTAPAGSPPGFPAALGATATFGGLVVGAPGNLPAVPGKAYFFAPDLAGTWPQFAELGGTAAEGHGFGTAVATNGTRIVVGNPLFGSSGKTFSYDLITLTDPPVWSLFCTREGSPGDAVGSAVAAMGMYSLSAAPWSDLAGADAGAVFVDRAGAYEMWAAAQGASFTQWFPEDDADGDGLANLGEFGLGGNPLSSSSRPPLVMTQTTFSNGVTSFPAMRWDRPSLPYSTAGLNYQMHRSIDLIHWINASPDGGLGIGDPPGRYFRITGDRGFFRIEFQYPATLALPIGL